MIAKISYALAHAWAKNGIIPQENAPIYSYGIQLILSTICNFVIIILISFGFDAPFAWLFFILAFIPLRMFAGGFHAPNHLACILTFGISFILCMILGELSPVEAKSSLSLVYALISWSIVFVFAPVEASNKPLGPKQQRKNRTYSICLTSVYLFAALFQIYSSKILCENGYYFYLGEMAASLSLGFSRITPSKSHET